MRATSHVHRFKQLTSFEPYASTWATPFRLSFVVRGFLSRKPFYATEIASGYFGLSYASRTSAARAGSRDRSRVRRGLGVQRLASDRYRIFVAGGFLSPDRFFATQIASDCDGFSYELSAGDRRSDCRDRSRAGWKSGRLGAMALQANRFKVGFSAFASVGLSNYQRTIRRAAGASSRRTITD